MDALFINTTILKKELFFEAMKVRFKATRSKFRIFVLLSSILFLFISLLFLINLNVFGLVPLAFSIIYFFFFFFKGYLVRTNREYKSYQALNPSFQTTFNFYDDMFVTVTTDSTRKTMYSQITKIVDTKGIYVFLFVESYMILDKSNFQKGNNNDFYLFIKSKCPLSKM